MIVISRNKYKLDHNYFDSINNEHKAYILGFLFADGNVSQNKYYINIDVSNNDIEVLNYICQQIYKEQPPYIIRIIKNCTYCKLQISSKHMANKLSEYGCIPNKTSTLKLPSEDVVSKELQRHFIRGYFDGDGCITFRENNPIIFILGNKDPLESFKKILEENNVIGANIILDRTYYRLQITSLKGAYWFYMFIYDKIESYYFKRKKQRFDSIYEKMSKYKDKEYTSKIKGVCFDKSRNTWNTTYNKKHYGRFKTELEAIQKRKEVEKNE